MNIPARLLGVAFLATAAVLAAADAFGQTVTWQTSSGGWSNAANWSGDAVPTASDTVYIVNGGTATISQPDQVACSTLSLGSSAGSGTVLMTGGHVVELSYAYIGDSGIGAFTQSGGTFPAAFNLVVLGNNAGASGTYSLSGSGLLSAEYEDIGLSGIGSFTQTGGTNLCYYPGGGDYDSGLTIGYSASSSGSYSLSGTGLLSASTEYIGYSGTGNFTQTGGTNSAAALILGTFAGSHGTYTLSGRGLLTTQFEYVGAFGSYVAGTFAQSGGTNSTGSLSLGSNYSNGNYSLSGGLLLTSFEQIQGAQSVFQQTGGTNMASAVIISGGRYLLSGGLLELSSGLQTAGGTLDCGGGSATIQIGSNSIVDLTGSVVNTASTSLTIGANSLLIVPQGFSSAEFQTFANLGIIHTAGTTLTVSAGTGFGGSGTITDPVNCQGSIIATPGGAINLTKGLTLSGTGQVNLGSGTLTVNNNPGSITGGSLSASSLSVGSSGTGSFSQSGGTNSLLPSYLLLDGNYIENAGTGLYVGNAFGSSGTYALTGSGLLNASLTNVYIGYSGSGSFTQSGGTHTVFALYLGYNVGSSGTYALSGSGLLNASPGNEYIGYSGSGSFVQSGGTNSLSSNLYWGSGLYVGEFGSGTYNLSGSGLLSAPIEFIGDYGSGSLTQTGGTNSAGSLYLANSYGSSGTYNLKGGLLSAPSETIGYFGSGSFTQSGGANSVSNDLEIGVYAGSSGTYSLSGSGLLSLAGLGQVSGSAAFNFSGGTLQAASSFATSVPIVLSTAGSNGVFDTEGNTLTLAGALSGLGGLQKVGAGTLTLSASNGYTGATLINAGTLSLANSAALAGNGPITFGGGTLQFTASNTRDYSSRILNSAGPIQIDSKGQGVTFASSLASSNSGGLTKLGAGTLTLSASNGYTGATLVSYGTLVLANTGAISGSTFDTTGAGALSFGTLTSATFGGLQGSGNLALNNATSAAVSLSVGGNNSSTTFSGGLSGSGSLTKIGAGTLTLAVSNSYTGGTTVSNGVLELGTSTALPSNSSVTLNGGTLDLGGVDQQVASLSDGTPGSGGSIVNSNTGVTSVLTLTPTTGSTTFSGMIMGGGTLGAISLMLDGPATLVLAGTNTYTGGTDVGDGTLVLESNEAIADGSSLTVGADATLIFGPSLAGAPAASTISPVPEPGTLALLLAGAALLATYRKRR
ncbi:MAG: beta strand repeat-containing protein [Thermoguttaceae bacterium]